MLFRRVTRTERSILGANDFMRANDYILHPSVDSLIHIEVLSSYPNTLWCYMCCTTASSIRSDLSPEARTVLVCYDVDLLKLMEVLSLLLTTGFFLRKDSLKY